MSTYFFITSISFVYTQGLSISAIGPANYTTAEKLCNGSDGGVLLSRSLLNQVNISTIIGRLEQNESVWIGGEKFLVGCPQNSSGIDMGGLCTNIIHEKIPTDYKLNFTCVKDDSMNMTVIEASFNAFNFSEATKTCGMFAAQLPSLTDEAPLYKLPNSIIKSSELGLQWFEEYHANALRRKVIHKCPMLTKVDECTVALTYDSCTTSQKGLCMTGTETVHDSLRFVRFTKEDGDNEISYFTDQPSCHETTTERTDTTPQSTTSIVTSKQTTVADLDLITTIKDSTTKTEKDHSTVQAKSTESTKTKPTAKPRDTSENSGSNLWIVAVVIVTLLVILIIALIMVVRRKEKTRRLSIESFSVNQNRHSTSSRKRMSTADVSEPVAGSLRKMKNGAQSKGKNPLIEVLAIDTFEGLHGQDIEVKDLDEHAEETKLVDTEDGLNVVGLDETKDLQNKEAEGMTYSSMDKKGMEKEDSNQTEIKSKDEQEDESEKQMSNDHLVEERTDDELGKDESERKDSSDSERDDNVGSKPLLENQSKHQDDDDEDDDNDDNDDDDDDEV